MLNTTIPKININFVNRKNKNITKNTNNIAINQFISLILHKKTYHCQLLILTFYDNDTIYKI